MSALSEKRLAEIRERVTCPSAVQAVQTGEFEACAAELVASDVHVLLAEVERLRAGIDELRGAVRLGARINVEPAAVDVLQTMHDDLVRLLNPTEGES